MTAPLIKSVAVVKPKVRVPVEVVPGTMSPATEKAAVETADTAPAAKAGRALKDVLVESMPCGVGGYVVLRRRLGAAYGVSSGSQGKSDHASRQRRGERARQNLQGALGSLTRTTGCNRSRLTPQVATEALMAH